MASEFKLSLPDIQALFKIKYEKLENVYNSANVLLGRVKKSYNFTGAKLQISIPQSFSGGVGSGSLPTANAARYVAAEITAKKVYAPKSRSLTVKQSKLHFLLKVPLLKLQKKLLKKVLSLT